MKFFIGYMKKILKLFGIFFIFFSCFSCQNLNRSKKADRTNVYIDIDRKNHQAQQTKNFYLKRTASQLIDQNYFEVKADFYYLKAERAFFSADNTKALQFFKRALLFAPYSVQLQKRLADIYKQEGLLTEAFRIYRDILQRSGQNKEIHQELTDIYIFQGMFDRALAKHQYLLNQEPDSFSLWFKQALLFASQKNWDSAIKALETAESKAFSLQERFQALLYQSYIFIKSKNTSRALKIMNSLQALQIPEREDLVLKTADLYQSLGQTEKGIDYLEDFQKQYGVKSFISKVLFDHYISSENWDKALSKLYQIQSLGQLENHHYFYMAMFFIKRKNYDSALLFLKDLRAKNPKNSQYIYLQAFVQEKRKNWLKAIKLYNQVENSDSQFLSAQIQSALLFQNLGQNRKSLSLLKKLSFSEEGYKPQALLFYAESLWNLGYKKKSIHVLTKALGKHPLHTDVLFLRGYYLKKSGNWNQALNDMEQILKLEKNHGEALNFIASFYSERGTHLNKAEDMARQALSIQPHSSYFLSTLGWILYQKGDLKSALHYLKQAFLKNNKDSHIAKRLGKVYLQLNNSKESNYFFEEALRLGKNDKALESKNKKFIFH